MPRDREFQLITFNGKRFDLPRLRGRLAYYGLSIPWLLLLEAYDLHYDVMVIAARYFSTRNSDFISLVDIIELLNIPTKKLGTWEQVKEWMETEQYGKVLEYCLRDVDITYQAALKMQNQRNITLPTSFL